MKALEFFLSEKLNIFGVEIQVVSRYAQQATNTTIIMTSRKIYYEDSMTCI